MVRLVLRVGDKIQPGMHPSRATPCPRRERFTDIGDAPPSMHLARYCRFGGPRADERSGLAMVVMVVVVMVVLFVEVAFVNLSADLARP
jgi:hypothetical protein